VYVVEHQLSETNDPALDTSYFQQKMALFERQYDPLATQALIRELGDRFQPTVEITFDDIKNQYPHYLKLLTNHPSLEAFFDRYFQELQPFCQAPFALPGGRVIQGPWMGDYKLYHFPRCEVNPETVAKKRVLDIGCNAGFDTFYLSTLGPSEIIGIEPAPLFYYQALLLWSIYSCPNLRFLKARWQDITTSAFGRFDLINCQGILYHEPSPMLLLEALFDLLTPGGMLVIETHVTLDDDMKALFVEGAFWGDYNWFWIPSGATVCAMLRACGFEEVTVRAKHPVPSKNPDDPLTTIEGVPVGGRAFLTARRPLDERVFRPKYGG
jgi:tRNA (mo5U34)-methyltransferase